MTLKTELMAAENSAYHYSNALHLNEQKTSILNCYNILQYYMFFYSKFNQINAALVFLTEKQNKIIDPELSNGSV